MNRPRFVLVGLAVGRCWPFADLEGCTVALRLSVPALTRRPSRVHMQAEAVQR